MAGARRRGYTERMRTITRHGSHSRHHERPSVEQDLFAFDWAASGWAGIAAGAAFILLQTALVTLFEGGQNTDAIRLIAAIAVGSGALPAATPLTAIIYLAAMGVHMILSLIYARILALCIDGMTAQRAVLIGAAFGAGLYILNYYVFTAVFPWFAVSRGWITLTSHVAFGVIAASIYAGMTGHKPEKESPTFH